MRRAPVVIALLAVLALAACAPVTEGPRSLNDALLDAHERNEVMPGR